MNLFTVLMFLGVSCVQDWRTICGVRFIENYDGDTLTVTIPNGGHPIFSDNIPVRMLGIDAPEMDSTSSCEAAKAKEAKELAFQLLSKAKKIDLQFVARDKYFRLLAVPVADGLSVPQQLIDAKLAVGYDGATKPKIDWCANPPKIKSAVTPSKEIEKKEGSEIPLAKTSNEMRQLRSGLHGSSMPTLRLTHF